MSLYGRVIAENQHGYPDAGEAAQPEVKSAIKRFRKLPLAKRADQPLLYWLLGEGTPDLKMSKADADYQTGSKGKQKCGNCEFAYKKVVRNEFICSQVSGLIKPNDWCRLWKASL